MNTLKRISAIVLALVMVLSLGVTVFAAEPVTEQGPFTITINKKTTDVAGGVDNAKHTYEAYQVFAGTVAKDGDKVTLSNIEWGNGLDIWQADGKTLDTTKYGKLIEELQKIDIGTDGVSNKPFASITTDTTAEKIAEILNDTTKLAKNHPLAQKFADAVSLHLSSTHYDSTEDDYSYEIEVPNGGYYLIKDKDNSLKDGESAYTDFVLEVVHSLTVTAKADAPELDKVIVEEGEDVKQNEVSIGDTITYKLKSKVPDMEGYNYYKFVVTDTFSEGLTFDGATAYDELTKKGMKVTIDGQPLTLCSGENHGEDGHACDYYVNVKDGGVIEIVFVNFIQYADKKGKDIVITYTATLNEKAKVTKEGNENKADLDFSNNPNYKYDKDTDEFKPDEPKGETPESKTTTWTTGAKIYKYYLEDEQNRDAKTALAGAQFTISGEKLNKVVEYGSVFLAESDKNNETKLEELGVKSADAASAEYKYWKLTNGSYTTTSPTTEGIDKTQYEGYTDDDHINELTKYALVDFTKVQTQASGTITLEGYTDEDGNIVFDGLEAGTYHITEVTAPNGFNKLKEDIILEIDCVWDTDHYDWYYRYYKAGTQVESGKPSDENGLETIENYTGDSKWTKYYCKTTGENDAECVVEIENKQGLELPSTGGMGTTIFYIVGGLMLVVALAVCVAKVMAPKAVSTKLTAENI